MKQEQINERIQRLLGLAQTQGFITFRDVNAAFPPEEMDSARLDGVLILLRGLEVNILPVAPQTPGSAGVPT